MKNFVPLSALAKVSSGTALSRHGQGAKAVMVGDLDGTGRFAKKLTEMGPPKAGEDAKLRAGDVVISLRGNANFCAVVSEDVTRDHAVFATLDLAVIRLDSTAPVSSRFLATYLNLPSTQVSLAIHRSGSAALRLPLGPLQDLLIPVPSADRQAMIVALNECAFEERVIAAQLADRRANLINELLRQAAAEGPASGNSPMQASTDPNGPGTTERALSTRAER